jgi:hypothetical protein
VTDPERGNTIFVAARHRREGQNPTSSVVRHQRRL